MINREFTVAGAYAYNRKGPIRWIMSHMGRNRWFLALWLGATVLAAGLIDAIPTRTGAAFTEILSGHSDGGRLGIIALSIVALVLIGGAADVAARLAVAVLGKRLARDARDELYLSLLGKSQTFHNRQRVGDIMARSNNDISLLSDMIMPGLDLIVDSSLNLVIPLVFIAFINPQLLIAPVAFAIVFAIALRDYVGALNPVSHERREAFGELNAGLAETIRGIEVVKATAQEEQERGKFRVLADRYRVAFIRSGQIQARYIPPLVLAIALVGAFAHGVYLLSLHQISIGQLVAYMGLMGLLRFPTFISIFSFSLVQLGVTAARRILGIMQEETELDENQGGYVGQMRGAITFEHVTFSYAGNVVLKDVSFQAMPGATVAIVGQTGTGKSTLTKLVNRTYDVDAGRVLVDGVDVRDWNLDSLRSQISAIEQDIFLFSRTVAENIGFSGGTELDQAAIEAAAHDAQADEFIRDFKDGYATVVGERGVTLSGGQRQRLAIARALLTDPRILILDDSTSAIDSATEDLIQQAIKRLLENRTTLLITHRLSQIRWADTILVLRGGEVIDQGGHEALLARCETYQRIFAHYGAVVVKG